ncbi:MAG: nucleotidyltransferase domain-containing protein [Campylobacterales bacterium]|nr:nucleotidyltransferase domain-containing protein [Campylobacterales bacterium]
MILRTKDRDSIIKIAQQSLQTPLEIWAFGSRVNGDAHDTSDLDLVIKSKSGKKLNIHEFVGFKEALRDSNIPILIDLLDWYRIPQSFHQNILNNYEVLYSSKELA